MQSDETDQILLLVHNARQACLLQGEDDVRVPFVQLMTAAAIAGGFMERSPEELHEVLDKVIPAAVQIIRDLDGEMVKQ